MARDAACPDCGGPMYRYAKTCNACKSKGERNSRYGAKLSAETREKIRVAALARPRSPRKRRSSSPDAGREFARRWFALPDVCERCGEAPPVDRHHIDGNPQNNAPTNIAALCRRCHQIVDGRHERMRHEIPSLGGKAVHAKRREGDG